MAKSQDIRLTFANYNYAFNAFYDNYKETCVSLANKTSIKDLGTIRKLVTTFIYEYDFTIDDSQIKENYRKQLRELKDLIVQDEEIARFKNKDLEVMSNMIEYQNKYYVYFLRYLDIFGRYISELTETFMPNTNIQKKQLRFFNNQAFFEKFTQHKKEVVAILAEFNIKDFSMAFNSLLTFYYAYGLFINIQDKIIIDRIFSLLVSFYLSKENLHLLMEQEPSNRQIRAISHNSNLLHDGLLYINSIMNQNFSNYDVLPKIEKKVYEDRTLI